MIVRIMGEGQWKLADSHIVELNRLDDELLEEMESGDEEG
ncbi:PspA-associated protein PspAA, partial [Streptomyces tanashiensis]